MVRIRATRRLMRMPPRIRGSAHGGARNLEFEELRRRSEEL